MLGLSYAIRLSPRIEKRLATLFTPSPSRVGHPGDPFTLDTATVEAKWLHELLMDLPVVEKPMPAILMNCDNQTVIAKVNSTKDNAKSSRHVKRRLKSVRKLRNSGVISVTHIQTDKNLADPFTKGLSRNVIDSASREMGMRPV